MSFNAETYFQEIAETLKVIANSSAGNHFTKAENIAKMEGFLAEMQYAEGYQLVLMDSFRAQLIDNKSDNILQKRFFTYFLLKNYAEGTFSGKYQIIDNCKAVVDKITAKMLNDRANYLNMMHRLDVPSLTFTQVGPVGSNWWGINVSFFMLDHPGSIVYNNDDWTEPVIIS
ncbi:MAG: hypothetical protein EOL88_06115 [Bacteroidia bacterium]|nr:hypothetical protein [Bacteroidia bacterium]